jgi:hypothetical protein
MKRKNKDIRKYYSTIKTFFYLNFPIEIKKEIRLYLFPNFFIPPTKYIDYVVELNEKDYTKIDTWFINNGAFPGEHILLVY